MKHNVETLVDQSCFEIIVGYDWEKTDSFEAEPGNPGTLVEGSTFTELTSVEVVIAGVGIDILPKLSEKAKIKIINELTYE